MNYKEYFKRKSYKDYFRARKITMIGLGLLGRGLNDAKFLAECGADLTITDLKTAEQLKPTIKKLAKFKSIKYVLGGHRLEDFRNCDLVLKSAGVPIDSPYIAEARKNNIPVEMDESLFAKLATGVKTIGITGTRGKTTTTYIIYEILKNAFDGRVHRHSSGHLKTKVFLGGNIKGLATLPLLKKVQPGDIVVMELSSWQLQGFGDAKISPNIAVFTNILDDHLNYYRSTSLTTSREMYFSDKANIYKFQKKDDFVICGKNVVSKIGDTISKKIIAKKTDVPKDWKLKIKGEHNLENIACAIKVAEVFGVPRDKIKKAVCNFNGVEGRQELIREFKGIKIYNDTTSTTPDATVVALKALGDYKKNIVLIMGGADKSLDMSELIKEISKYCKNVVLLSGSGSEKLQTTNDKLQAKKADTLKKAVKIAIDYCKKGDILLFSPAFASFGMFINEFDRGEQFNKIIKGLK